MHAETAYMCLFARGKKTITHSCKTHRLQAHSEQVHLGILLTKCETTRSEKRSARLNTGAWTSKYNWCNKVHVGQKHNKDTSRNLEHKNRQ